MAKKRCARCSCGVFILLLLAATGGILIWQFLPSSEKSAFSAVIDPSNDQAPPPTYQFIQCNTTTSGGCCNGLTSNCALRASDILYAGLHNGMSSTQDGFFIAPNQNYDLESALLAGYRAINIDMAKCGSNDTLLLIHGNCNLGQRDPVQVMTHIYDFIVNHPTEVVLIIIEVHNAASPPDNPVTVDDIEWLINQVPGLQDQLYNHTVGDDWPYLQDMIDMDQRIILSYYYAATCYQDGCPDGINEWFIIGKESQYDFHNVEQILNTTYSCEITRGRVKMQRGFWGLNNFVTLPSKTASKQINSLDFVHDRLKNCSNMYSGEQVNVLFVDFWDLGDVPQAVQIHNRQLAIDIAAANQNATTNTTTTTFSDSTESSSSSTNNSGT